MSLPISRSNLFDDFFNDWPSGFFVRPLHGDALPNPSQIKIDVKDSDSEYVVHADLPGVRKEDIHVNVENGLVSLKAEINQMDQKSSEGKVIRTERYSGSISRSFSLPTDVDVASAKAKYENGVLTLNLPKSKAAKSTRLQIL